MCDRQEDDEQGGDGSRHDQVFEVERWETNLRKVEIFPAGQGKIEIFPPGRRTSETRHRRWCVRSRATGADRDSTEYVERISMAGSTQ